VAVFLSPFEDYHLAPITRKDWWMASHRFCQSHDRQQKQRENYCH